MEYTYTYDERVAAEQFKSRGRVEQEARSLASAAAVIVVPLPSTSIERREASTYNEHGNDSVRVKPKSRPLQAAA